MCYWANVAQAGLSIAGTVMGQREAEANAKAARQAAIQNMNYSFQNYELQRQDTYDATVREIEKIRRNAMQLNSGVQVAINEDIAGGGRTADLLMRNAKGDEARTISSVKENYDRKSNEIDINKEGTLVSAKSQVNSIQAPSRLSAAVNIASSVIGAYTGAKNAQTGAQVAGNEWDFWRGNVVRNKK